MRHCCRSVWVLWWASASRAWNKEWFIATNAEAFLPPRRRCDERSPGASSPLFFPSPRPSRPFWIDAASRVQSETPQSTQLQLQRPTSPHTSRVALPSRQPLLPPLATLLSSGRKWRCEGPQPIVNFVPACLSSTTVVSHTLRRWHATATSVSTPARPFRCCCSRCCRLCRGGRRRCDGEESETRQRTWKDARRPRRWLHRELCKQARQEEEDDDGKAKGKKTTTARLVGLRTGSKRHKTQDREGREREGRSKRADVGVELAQALLKLRLERELHDVQKDAGRGQRPAEGPEDRKRGKRGKRTRGPKREKRR